MGTPNHIALRQLAAQLLAIGAALMDIADGIEPPSQDLLYLARAIQGEGAAMFGVRRDEVGLAIAHTAMNRLGKSYWPDTLQEIVTQAFHGYVNVQEPEAWALELARQAMVRENDLVNGAVFMLSHSDLVARHWTDRASEAVRIIESPDGQYRFYFFREWPGRNRQW